MALPFITGTVLQAADLNLLAPIDSPSFTTKLTIGSGATGLVAMPYTGGGLVALYSTGVTPSTTNHAFLANSTSTYLNSPSGAFTKIQVGGVDVVAATSTGAAVTGTLSSTGWISTPSGITSSGGNNLALSYNGGANGLIVGNALTRSLSATTQIDGVLTVPAGTAGAKSIQIGGTATTGLYAPASGFIYLNAPTATSLSVGDSNVLVAQAGSVTSLQPLLLPAGTSVANAIQFGGSATTGFYSPGAGTVATPGNFYVGSTAGALTTYGGIINGGSYIQAGNTLISPSAPTIASGFGTSPSIVASNTAAFKVTIGTGGAASGVLTFPAATNGWAVHCTDVTNRVSIVAVAVSTSTTSVTVEAYSRTTGLASTFTAGDVLEFSALGY